MTKCFKDRFKGNNVIAIWAVDEEGKKVGTYPLVSFGAKKAKLIAAHIAEIAEFAEEVPTPEADVVTKAVFEDFEF